MKIDYCEVNVQTFQLRLTYAFVKLNPAVSRPKRNAMKST